MRRTPSGEPGGVWVDGVGWLDPPCGGVPPSHAEDSGVGLADRPGFLQASQVPSSPASPSTRLSACGWVGRRAGWVVGLSVGGWSACLLSPVGSIPIARRSCRRGETYMQFGSWLTRGCVATRPATHPLTHPHAPLQQGRMGDNFLLLHPLRQGVSYGAERGNPPNPCALSKHTGGS